MTRKYTILGTSDEVTTCDCCGKKNLRSTVALEATDGSGDVHFGRVCAARALEWGDTPDDGRRVQRAAERREEARRETAERAAYEANVAAMRQYVCPSSSPYANDGDRAEWHVSYVYWRESYPEATRTKVVRSVYTWRSGSDHPTESIVFWIEEFVGSPSDAISTMADRAARGEKSFAAIRWMRQDDNGYVS